MNKRFSFFIAICAMAMATNAQGDSSANRSMATNERANYNRVFLSYAPMFFSGFSDDLDKEHPHTIHGVAVGLQRGWALSKQIPLYIEVGVNAKYNRRRDVTKNSDSRTLYYADETWKFGTHHWSLEVKNKKDATFLSFNVPINLSCRFTFSDFSIAPYVGLHLTCNLIGIESNGIEIDESDYVKTDDDYITNNDHYGDTNEINYFSKLDMGGEDYTANRIQWGWQAGIAVNYKRLYIGAGYSAEFTDYITGFYIRPDLTIYTKGITTSTLTISVGMNF